MQQTPSGFATIDGSAQPTVTAGSRLRQRLRLLGYATIMILTIVAAAALPLLLAR